ncbi:hypothetical protein BHM03_00047405 [Ensete ventricosum]|nr:hypothetical protein BHM03_00047405 [Ensete ventricosum]
MALGELVSRSQIPEGGVVVDPPINGASASASERKKVRESERRRRRRKPKKNDSKSAVSFADYDEKRGVEGGEIGAAEDERNDYPEVKMSVEVEYVPERADVDESIFEEFKNVLEKFNFRDHAGVEDDSTKDETMGNATTKKGDSDTEEDEQETQQKEKGLSNKKKKVSNRYGPPPSYPHLKIPGLNAPIPPGASFGYHPGGWGKPPVDEVSISTPTGVETPDVIDLRKQQRKEPEKPLYQVNKFRFLFFALTYGADMAVCVLIDLDL